MTVQHAVIWIDHHEARLFRLAPDGAQKVKIHGGGQHFHRSQDSLGSRQERDRIYYGAIAEAMGDIPEILLLGPGLARSEFQAWLQEHQPARCKHVLDNQACDDVGDAALLEKGRHFFRAADRMLPR